MTKLYLLALGCFLVVDGLWLGLVAKNFYSKHLGYLMTAPPNWMAAVIFYLIYIAGIVILIVQPAMEKGGVMEAVIRGGIFGLTAYATYDLTNLATIGGWPMIVTIVDLIWGTVLSGTVAGVTVWLAQKWW